MNLYKNLKALLHKSIPKKMLLKYEDELRFFYYLFYKGKKYQCNVCEKQIKSFIVENGNKICPRCGSLARGRKLFALLENQFLFENSEVLHFSPPRYLFSKLKKKKIKYVTTDYEDEFIAEHNYNIKDIAVASEKFDLIICYHVLEHVDEDQKAISELFRVLKKGGFCLVQTPFKEGEIYENDTVTSPSEREKHFGQNDHVRIYSREGLKERLENVGFKVCIKLIKSDLGNKSGFNLEETILICEKN